MRHRERVRAILNGDLPDQPLFDMGGRVASLSTPAYMALKSYLGFGDDLGSEQITALNTIGVFDERVLQFFDIPFRRVFLRSASSYELKVSEDGSFHDEWGVTYRPMGYYNERVGHPLANAELKDLDLFPWLDPYDQGRVKGLKEEAHSLYEETNYSLAAGHISAGIFQDCWNLRGMEKFFMDLIINPDFAEALLDKVTSIHIGMWELFLDTVGEYIDIVETADDLGGQSGLLISPQMYREMIKPRQAALNAAIRKHTKASIFYHSCGAIMDLIPDLIEIGVDVLNPIQPLPGLMDPESLHAQFGNRLIFHGGLDVQVLLIEGTPEQVHKHVCRYYDSLGLKGYILAPANSVQPGTPPENIEAAYTAARNYKQ